MSKKAKVITVTKDGTEIKLLIKHPTPRQLSDAQIYATRAFRKAIESGAMPRAHIDDYLRKNGYWNEDKQVEFDELREKLVNGEKQLSRGGKTKDGKKFTKKEARKLALEMQLWRTKIFILMAKERELDKYSVESITEDSRFNYLVSCSTYYADKSDEDGRGVPVFETVEAYLDEMDEEYASKSAAELANLMFGLSDDYEKNLPENKFLLKHKFMTDDMKLVDEQGRLVDADGKLVSEDGWYLEGDKKVDVFGDDVDIEYSEFEE